MFSELEARYLIVFSSASTLVEFAIAFKLNPGKNNGIIEWTMKFNHVDPPYPSHQTISSTSCVLRPRIKETSFRKILAILKPLKAQLTVLGILHHGQNVARLEHTMNFVRDAPFASQYNAYGRLTNCKLAERKT